MGVSFPYALYHGPSYIFFPCLIIGQGNLLWRLALWKVLAATQKNWSVHRIFNYHHWYRLLHCIGFGLGWQKCVSFVMLNMSPSFVTRSQKRSDNYILVKSNKGGRGKVFSHRVHNLLQYLNEKEPTLVVQSMPNFGNFFWPKWFKFNRSFSRERREKRPNNVCIIVYI